MIDFTEIKIQERKIRRAAEIFERINVDNVVRQDRPDLQFARVICCIARPFLFIVLFVAYYFGARGESKTKAPRGE